jgi:hypothetical protein
MPRIGYRALATLFATLLLAGAADPPPELRRGINVTHWFRFPPDRSPEALRAYLDDAALDALKHAGFTFIRLPVQTDLLTASDSVVDAIARIQRHGLAVVVALFDTEGHPEADASDRARLILAWRRLAPALRHLAANATFPEVLNEPVFAGQRDAWAALQHQALATIRAALPANTIVLTGADWGSVDGLLSLHPEADPRVIYSFHLYEPAELTALGAYRAGLDAAAMARLPFPVTGRIACEATADTTLHAPTADLIRFYCSQRWDAAKIAARVAQAAAWARRNGVAVLAGEFGASQRLNAPARLAWLAAVREACEQQGIGWALWGYDDSMGLAIRPPGDRRPIDQPLLQALGLDRDRRRRPRVRGRSEA